MVTANHLRYVGTGIYIVALTVAALVLNPIGTDEASITNTFAAVSGVLIGLYFVIPQTAEIKKARPTVMWLLLISLLVSVISSMRSLSSPYDWADSKVVFVISAGFFSVSTAYLVAKVGLLSDAA